MPPRARSSRSTASSGRWASNRPRNGEFAGRTAALDLGPCLPRFRMPGRQRGGIDGSAGTATPGSSGTGESELRLPLRRSMVASPATAAVRARRPHRGTPGSGRWRVPQPRCSDTAGHMRSLMSQNGQPAPLTRAVIGRSARAINVARERNEWRWQPGYRDHGTRAEEGFADIASCIVANSLHAGLARRPADHPHGDAVRLQGRSRDIIRGGSRSCVCQLPRIFRAWHRSGDW